MGLEELDLLEAFSQAATLAELRRYAEPVNRNETAGSRAGEELDNVATARELGLDEDGVLRPCQLRDLRGKDVVGAPPAGAAPRESRSRWSKRVIMEPRFSPDQRRQINDLPAAEVLAKDKSLLTVTAKRVIWAPLYRTSVESCPTST